MYVAGLLPVQMRARVPKRQSNRITGVVAGALAWQVHWLLECTLTMWCIPRCLIVRCLLIMRLKLAQDALHLQGYIEGYSSLLCVWNKGSPAVVCKHDVS
jgi:hypothetical protein